MSLEGVLHKVAVSVAVVLLAGCAGVNYSETLETWVGAQAVELVRSWGAPTRSFRLPNGHEVYVYEERRTQTFSTPVQVHQNPGYWIGNTYFPGRTTVTGGQTTNISLWCVTEFEVDNQGRIVHWRYNGNNCR